MSIPSGLDKSDWWMIETRSLSIWMSLLSYIQICVEHVLARRFISRCPVAALSSLCGISSEHYGLSVAFLMLDLVSLLISLLHNGSCCRGAQVILTVNHFPDQITPAVCVWITRTLQTRGRLWFGPDTIQPGPGGDWPANSLLFWWESVRVFGMDGTVCLTMLFFRLSS